MKSSYLIAHVSVASSFYNEMSPSAIVEIHKLISKSRARDGNDRKIKFFRFSS